MKFSTLSDHGKGLLLTTIGGLALSMDIPLIRLSDGAVWSILGLRNIITFAIAAVLLLLLRASGRPWRQLLPGWTGLWVVLFYGIGTISFVLAVYYTSAANVVFILAFNPMFAALLSWIVVGERPSAATIITMLAMVVGVGLIVGDGIDGGHWVGDLLALMSALLTACALTIGRRSKRDMGFMPMLATVIPGALGLAYALPVGLAISNPFWITLDGGLMMPLAFWCLASGTRYLSSPEVAMFYLLETILAPVWIWMIFAEAPSRMTLVGGAVMMVALASHSLWQARVKGRKVALAG
jgi:drug/metabolite transporter (DMT)-like permease